MMTIHFSKIYSIKEVYKKQKSLPKNAGKPIIRKKKRVHNLQKARVSTRRKKYILMIGHQLTYTSLIKSHLNSKTKFLQLPSTVLYVLKLLHDCLIINAIEYVLFDIHKQTIIHPLIFHLIA